MLRKALKISRPLPLVSGEVPRFHGGSLWHSTPGGPGGPAGPGGPWTTLTFPISEQENSNCYLTMCMAQQITQKVVLRHQKH